MENQCIRFHEQLFHVVEIYREFSFGANQMNFHLCGKSQISQKIGAGANKKTRKKINQDSNEQKKTPLTSTLH